MTTKWVTPFVALLLGALGLVSNVTPNGELLWTGVAQAATAQDNAATKQLLLDEAANDPVAMLLAEPKAGTSFLEVAVNKVGGFTCGIPGGAMMLYGHPTPTTSGTTVQVDGVNYWNYKGHSFGTVVTAPQDVDAVTSEGVWNIADGKIKLTENLQVIDGDSGNADTLKITHTAYNQDSVAHNVGMRVMLDTYLGTTDGVPFRTAAGEITQETELTGQDVPLYWEAFESLTDPNSPKAQGTLNTDDGTMPDRLVFAADALRMLSAPWNFVVDPSVSILDGDSAVGVYWNPVAVQPGQSLTRTTFYGLSGMKGWGNMYINAPAALDIIDNSYSPNPFTIMVYVANNGAVALPGMTATLTLPAGLSLESGDLTQTIGTIAAKATGQVSWSVVASGAVTGTLTFSAAAKGTNFPEQTIDKTIDVPALTKATTTALTATPNPAKFGQDVSLNATVTADNGATATGDVVFSLDNATVATKPLSAGAASYTASGLTVGVHAASANYSGTTGFVASSSTNISVVVQPGAVNTTTTLSASPATATVGQPITLTAMVTAATADNGTPTGNVDFTLDGAVVATQALTAAGIAIYTANGLAVGSHTASANYAGVLDKFNASSSSSALTSFNVGNAVSLPTAITSPATSFTLTTDPATGGITANAKLNGKVTPNGAATTVSFIYGPSTAYGFTVAATPGSIAGSAAATIVGANITGLDPCTVYHYETVATNSAGTVYGDDVTFKTTGCIPTEVNPDAWLYQPAPIVLVGKPFTQDIHINTKGGVVAAYEFVITFDPSKVLVDTMYQNAAGTCDQGVCPGAFALSGAFVTTNNSAGTINLAAFDAEGTGPSNDLQVVQIHFIARNAPGIVPIDLTVNDLSDQLGDKIGNLGGRGSNVSISFGLCGDSDGTGFVNIVDALSIARKSVGLPPPPTINTILADVNRDVRVVATDAMHIARYSVGLVIGAVNACEIGQPLPPPAQ